MNPDFPRLITILSRWTEVKLKLLLEHKKEYQSYMDHTMFYTYENHLTVTLSFISCCANEQGEFSRCNHTKCDKEEFIPRCKVFVSGYKDDVLFSMYIWKEEQLPSLMQAFACYNNPSLFCVCGRLARHTHLVESERGKCNNCYVYGFVRGEECSICMLDDGKPWIKTSCGHHFHDLCWSKIEVSRYGIVKCPLCRSDQDEDTIERL
jgi:hypothetical protein